MKNTYSGTWHLDWHFDSSEKNLKLKFYLSRIISILMSCSFSFFKHVSTDQIDNPEINKQSIIWPNFLLRWTAILQVRYAEILKIYSRHLKIISLVLPFYKKLKSTKQCSYHISINATLQIINNLLWLLKNLKMCKCCWIIFFII